MTNFWSSISNQSRRKKIIGWVFAITTFAILLITFGCSTHQEPSSFWDGAFPASEFHIRIQSNRSNPIQGAVMSVFASGMTNWAFGYPIDNYLSNRDLISDEQGMIIAIHEPQGIEFGGPCWEYLVFFERCSDDPKYDGQISADGYETLKFSLNELLFKPGTEKLKIGTTSFTFENGEVAEIPIYEITFTLGQH
jgi:hypothetical protein